ncbi:sigma 54-interacting transcriptional regulator [bacterium]|nr:sigma 54-interacting transcriptional regulator [bacterium]
MKPSQIEGEISMSPGFTIGYENIQTGFSGETLMNLRFTKRDENQPFCHSGEGRNPVFTDESIYQLELDQIMKLFAIKDEKDTHKIDKAMQILQKIKDEGYKKLERKMKGLNRLKEYSDEAEEIKANLGHWNNIEILPYADMPLSILLLGACSGEWAAQSYYIGLLPGFGGFLLNIGNKKILVDPGRTTLDNLLGANINPKSIDYIIVTHSHWDCTRDLLLSIMAASGLNNEAEDKKRLKLLAARSVIYGSPMNEDDINKYRKYLLKKNKVEDEDALKASLKKIQAAQPAILNANDLFNRLNFEFETMKIGKMYKIEQDVIIYARRSYHPETYYFNEIPADRYKIPALDIIVKKNDQVAARCVYLSDTEYRKELAPSYADHLDELGPIDVLICNVKTLNVFTYKKGPYKGFTQKHLGWRGLIQLTKDLQNLGALKPDSMVVLRAWGIETVTRLNEDKTMIAMPEKLETYEKSYAEETGQEMVLIPYRTWVGVSRDKNQGIVYQHLKRPFHPTDNIKLKKFGQIFYRSKAMEDIVNNAKGLLSDRTKNVLITGETGTGKDELAKAIHTEACSKGYRNNIIVIVNAADLATDMNLVQMVGHAKGAYTGAHCDRKGWFEQAKDGTLIFDEIGDMLYELQAKLLTILQERRFQRLDDPKFIPLDAQIIFTTNRDLSVLIKQGRFRFDLDRRFQRRIHIPPLRERKEDIEALLYGWQEIGKCPAELLRDDIIKILQGYEWPGNVRTLENVIGMIKESGDFSKDNIREKANQENRMSDLVKNTNDAEPYLDPLEQKILSVLKENRGKLYTRRELQDILKQSFSIEFLKGTMINKLNRLISKGLVKKRPNGPNTRYQAV